jgi:drug/metabolite transporter (DMT)-like permease
MALIVADGAGALPRRDELVPWLVIGAINGAIPNTLVAFALTQMDSGPAALLQSAGPLITALAAHLLFADERLNRAALLGILVGFAGVAC